jgi:hypothetical protein
MLAVQLDSNQSEHQMTLYKILKMPEGHAICRNAHRQPHAAAAAAGATLPSALQQLH